MAGTVTFLFTDIEGSTDLLDQLGRAVCDSAGRPSPHSCALAIQKWNGQEVDTQGDAFFVTFARSLDALQCAAEAQRAVALPPLAEVTGPSGCAWGCIPGNH